VRAGGRPGTHVALALVVLGTPWAAVTGSGADRVVTRDGRVLEVREARRLADGSYRLAFEGGVIVAPAEAIASVEHEEDPADYVPRNDEEARRLELGYVRHDGRWMSKAAYAAHLRREAAERRRRVEDLARHARFEDGYVLETRHFLLKTNTSPELLDRYAALLEAFYEATGRRLAVRSGPTRARKKTRVNVYRSREDWEEADPDGFTRDVIGRFSRTDGTLSFVHAPEDPAATIQVALHEATHLMTYLVEPRALLPPWLDEGVAELLGSATVQRDERGAVELARGGPLIDHLFTVQEALREGTSISLAQLLGTGRRAFGPRVYAHAWSFVYFLDRSEHAGAFWAFFEDLVTLSSGVDHSYRRAATREGDVRVVEPDEVERLLLEALASNDLAALEGEWHAFVAALPIEGPEARFRRALAALRSGSVDRYPQAVWDVDRAIAGGFEDARAYWTRGVLRSWLQEGGLSLGVDDLRMAVELSPLDARYRHSLGQCLAGYRLDVGSRRKSVPEARTLRATEDELEEALESLALAADLAPGDERYRAEHLDLVDRMDRRGGVRSGR
jgi:hypothetical protein